MSNLAFQRAGWAFSITRTPRASAISKAANFPKRYNHSISEIPHFRPLREHFPHRSSTSDNASARRTLPSTRFFHQQQAQQQEQQQPTPSSPEPNTTGTPSSPHNLKTGLLDDPLPDPPPPSSQPQQQVDWTRSFHGLSNEAFSPETAQILLAPIPADDIEVKPDGIIYLPEIKYRRILNRAFGPGAWGLAPRGETIVTERTVTREYALVALGRYVHPAPCWWFTSSKC